MAVATSAMLRTWAVRLPAIELTESVKSFQVPATPGTWAWPPSLPSVPTSRATRVTSEAKELSWSTMVLMVSFSSRISPRTSTVILRDRSPFATAVVTSAMLRTCAVRLVAIALTESVRSFQVLAPQLGLGSPPAGHAAPLRREAVQLVHHGVDGLLELQDFTLYVDRDLARQVAQGDRRGHVGDVAHLCRQVVRHRVHVVGEVLPRAGNPGHRCLAAELALGSHLAGHAAHLRREAVELVDHRVDRDLQLEDLAADIDPELARQVAQGDRRGHVGDVAHLCRQVVRHRVHVVGQVLPRAGDARHRCLAAELALAPDLARHARHLRSKSVQLVHHGVDGVLQLEDLPLDVDRDLAGQAPARHGGGP